ncbi:hypothetical protein FAUST_10650 [Fusarium austroamericanum]|uniref:T6SS Phospholipase effector Tle1-like catalytic domain-containing protein n=1 Tax=Fusarium austroamericanum TaxID=282268 RepID=A0AAN6BV76_FUSAU|nr:hypothetical protein FAUST_10650 [Fusarium austroamericanum]
MAFGSSKNRQPRLIFVSLDGTLAGSLLSSRQTVISVLPKLISESHNVVPLLSKGPGSDISHTDRVLGGLCGWGTRRNVIIAYERLAGTYQPGDKIILSGYSRGAWAARYLALIIEAIGLPEQSDNPEFSRLLYQECDKNPNFESTVTPELAKFVCEFPLPHSK